MKKNAALMDRAIDKAMKDFQKMQAKADAMKADVEELHNIRDRINGQHQIALKDKH